MTSVDIPMCCFPTEPSTTACTVPCLRGVPRKGRLTAFTCKNSASPREEQHQPNAGGFLALRVCCCVDGRPDPGIDDPLLAEDLCIPAWGGAGMWGSLKPLISRGHSRRPRGPGQADRHVKGHPRKMEKRTRQPFLQKPGSVIPHPGSAPRPWHHLGPQQGWMS